MALQYALDDKPGPAAMLLYGLQWWVIAAPGVVLMGLIVAGLHHSDLAGQIGYMRKLFALMGVVTIVQVLAGHRLPLVVGPASVLLVGLTSSLSVSSEAAYSAILIGGGVLALIAWTGLLGRLRPLFTPRIVVVILALIALTLSPTILRLLFNNGREVFHLAFALFLVLGLAVCNALLPGVWKSLTVVIGICLGSLIHFLCLGFPGLPVLPSASAAPSLFIAAFVPDPGTILAFLFCFLALTINELGSVESIGHQLKAGDMAGRLKRGAGLQGLANMAAGSLGVIGSVDYSLSVGVVAATGCASRYPLVLAGAGLILCAVFPHLLLLLTCIPAPVMGALMLYLMASQLASGLHMLTAGNALVNYNSAFIVSLPLMIGLCIAFAPAAIFDAFPAMLRPIIGNGFVMGALTVILLEHGLFKGRAG